MNWLVALVAIAACKSSPAPAPDTGVGAHRVTVRIRGAGNIVGGVRSEPPGIDCTLAANDGGRNETECSANLAGTVKLTFVPSLPASVAQFSVTRGATREMCEGQNAATTCTLSIDSDVTIEVFPISVPPPAP